MMFRGLMRLGAANREPVIDNHPLARPDGGWYPGKRFDPTDILTDPGNWLVWKQFLIFFFSVLIIPIAVFIVVEWILRSWCHLHFQQSQTIGALVSVVCLQGLMYYYARLAVYEDRADRIAAAKKEGDQIAIGEAEVLQPENKETAAHSEATVDKAADSAKAGVETATVHRHGEVGAAPTEPQTEEKKEA